MGRVQNPSEAKMNAKQRIAGDGGGEGPARAKKRKGGPEAAGGADPTPSKDRRAWSPKEEAELVKMLVEHKAAGRTIPLTSRSAAYWSEVITLLYPGDKAVTQRRLYDKVRRMLLRYGEIKDSIRDKKPFGWKSAHEKALFDSWEKIFFDQMIPNGNTSASASKAGKAVNPNAVKVVEESSSEEEEDEEEHKEERIQPAKAAPPVRPRAPVQAPSESEEEEEEEEHPVRDTRAAPVSESEEEDEEDEDEEENSPDKPRPIQSGENGARFETIRSPRGELPKTPMPRVEVIQRSSQARGGGGMEQKEKAVAKDRPQTVANGSKRGRDLAGEGLLDAGVIKSLKAELFAYVHKLRDDCMRELDVVKNQLVSPARLQLAKKRQELFLEELALQEKELEINRRYCRLQKEVLNLQNTS